MFRFRMLSSLKLGGVRNGNWRRLSRLEKSLFDCSLELARVRDKIVNMRLKVRLAKIIFGLKATVKNKMIKVGRAKAQALRIGSESQAIQAI